MIYYPDNTTAFWIESGVGQVRSSGIYNDISSDIITAGLDQPYGIAVDIQDNRIYYGDYGTHTIKMAYSDGSDETIIASGLGHPREIAIDVINDKLYWCDSLSGTITKSDKDGGNNAVIVSGMNVYGIALDPDDNKMYWTVADASGSIMKANLDGSNIEYFTSGGELGDILTSGSCQTFYDGDIYAPKCVRLSDNKHVIIYSHSYNGPTNLYGRVIEYSDGIATSGDEVVIKTGTVYPDYSNATHIQRINDTQFFVLSAQDPATATELDIISLSGTLSIHVDHTTQVDSEFVFELCPTEMIPQTTGVSGVYVFTGKSLTNNKCYLRTIAISGTTVSNGSRVLIDDLDHTKFLSAAAFNDSELVVFFAPTGVNKSRYRYGSVSGLTINMGSSGIIGIDKLMEYPICEKLGTDRVVLFGEISDDDNRFYVYNLISSDNISGTPLNGIATQHSDRQSMVVMDNSTIGYCTHTGGTTSIGICKLTEISGTLGSIITKDEVLGTDSHPLFMSRVDNDSFTLYNANDGSNVGELIVFDVSSSGGSSTSGSLSYPKPLAIFANQNQLYWANHCDNKAEICYLDLLNSTSGVIIPRSSGYQSVNGLDVDSQNQKLYISDHFLDTVSRANIDGSDIETIIDNLFNPIDIAMGISDPTDYVSLFISGPPLMTISSNLFIRGVSIIIPSSGEQVRPLDWVLKTPDYYPQIIGMFNTSANSVNIQLWDITNGHNTPVAIVNNGCYAIGNTDRWGWSTANLPAISGYTKHYFYCMTSDITETFDGQFILDVSEGAKWIHPNNLGDYVLRR